MTFFVLTLPCDAQAVQPWSGIFCRFSTVMAGLVPAIHVLLWFILQDVDARDRRGHDDGDGVVLA
jgi:hypothetical protein